MIAPALAPATFFQVVIGLVGCSAKPHSAPASASPLTPPPRKTPSASVIHSIASSSHTQEGPIRRSCRGRLLALCQLPPAQPNGVVEAVPTSVRVSMRRSPPPGSERRRCQQRDDLTPALRAPANESLVRGIARR